LLASSDKPTFEGHYVNSNSGMMMVVPAWKIRDLLDRGILLTEREANEEKLRRMVAEAPTGVMDAEQTGEPPTEFDAF
jgi:hypothetical protein